MSLNKVQFREWSEDYDPKEDIKVPKSRFYGTRQFSEDMGTPYKKGESSEEGAREKIGEAAAYASMWADQVDYPIHNLLAAHHIRRQNARDVFESIKKQGYDKGEPITAVGDKTSAYIINGHHRAIAARAAGMKTIPTILISDGDLYDAMWKR